MTKSWQVWPRNFFFWILRDCLTIRYLWKKLVWDENLYPYFLSCSITELRSFFRSVKACVCFSICCCLNVKRKAQAAGMNMFWIFSFSSLFTFSCDLANSALRLYIWKLCCWDFLALFTFFSPIVYDFLPQALWNLLSPALLNFNTFCINFTSFEDGDEASNGVRNGAGSRRSDGADSGNKGGASSGSKNRAAITSNGSIDSDSTVKLVCKM